MVWIASGSVTSAITRSVPPRHSGDMDFKLCYRGDFPGVLRALSNYGHNIRAYIEKIHSAKKVQGLTW